MIRFPSFIGVTIDKDAHKASLRVVSTPTAAIMILNRYNLVYTTFIARKWREMIEGYWFLDPRAGHRLGVL
jgi:hypothetical protein